MGGRTHLVLGHIVISASNSSNLDNRQSLLFFLVAPDSHGQLPALDEFLYQHFPVILECLRKSCFQLLRLFHNDYADAGALGRSLDYYRHAEFLQNLACQVALFKLISEICMCFRGRNPLCHKEPLGCHLVHGNGCCHDAGAGIWNPHHLKSALNDAVLAELAMEGVEHELRAAGLYVIGKGGRVQLQSLCIVSFCFQGFEDCGAAAA